MGGGQKQDILTKTQNPVVSEKLRGTKCNRKPKNKRLSTPARPETLSTHNPDCT
jgi:hypothetical protein